MLSPYLVVTFSNILESRNGNFYDDDDFVIPKDVIAFRESNYIIFADGWTFVADKDSIEIQYPSFTLFFADYNIKKINIGYRNRA